MAGASELVRVMMDAMANGGDGTYVTPESMLRCPPMWYAVNRICGHVGQLPLDLKRKLDRGAETATTDGRWTVVRKRPNQYQTPGVFKEQLTLHMLIFGDARAYVARQGGRVVELIPLDPYCTSTGLIMGEKVHLTKPAQDDRLNRYETPDGNGRVVLMDSDVVHLPNLSIDGVGGQRLYHLAKETIKTGLAADKRTSKGMEKGFTGQVMLEAPKNAFRAEKDAVDFLAAFKKQHSNSSEGEVVGLLRDDIKANVLQMTNTDAQFIEQRNFQRQEAALWFLLESIMGDDTSVSYNSLEQKVLAYLQNCLNRWLKRWEEELDIKLLAPAEQSGMFFRFNTGPLLRSDLASTMTALNTAVVSRIMSPNEAREKLDMNPYEGGDVYANPAISPGPANAKPAGGTSGAIARAAVVSRLSHMLGVEAKRVEAKRAAKEPAKNFEAFYGDWVKLLGDAIEDLGGDRALAVEHCQKSMEFVVANKPIPKPESRVDELADRIIGK